MQKLSLSAAEPLYDRIPGIKNVYGLRRSRIYQLLRDGKIDSKIDGKTRLINVPSVRRYLDSLPGEPTKQVSREMKRRTSAPRKPSATRKTLLHDGANQEQVLRIRPVKDVPF
jgi:hypothetical protein